MSKNHSNLAVLVLLLAAISWGLTWIPLKYLNGLGLEGIPLIFVVHALLLLVVLPLGFKRRVIKDNKNTLSGIALVGGAAILCFTYALMYGDVVRVMVLFYLLPVWGVLGGRLFLGERIDSLRWAGVVIAIPGAYLILGGRDIFASPPSWIDVLALVSGICFAGNNILFRAVEQVPLSTKLLAMFFGCSALSGALLLAEVQRMPLDVAPLSWLYLILYALLWMLFANVGSQWAVVQLESGQSSIILVMELVAAVLSAMWIGGQWLSLWEWVGCALVVFAALIEGMRMKHDFSVDQLCEPSMPESTACLVATECVNNTKPSRSDK